MGEASKDDVVRFLDGMRKQNDTQREGVPASPTWWWKLRYLDPALLRGAMVAVIAVFAAFGMVLDGQKTAAVVAAVGAVVALVQASSTRAAVTPNQKVVVYKPDPVDDPNRVASGDAVSTDITSVVNAAFESSNDFTRTPFDGRR